MPNGPSPPSLTRVVHLFLNIQPVSSSVIMMVIREIWQQSLIAIWKQTLNTRVPASRPICAESVLKAAPSLGKHISVMKEPKCCLRNYLAIKCVWGKSGQKTQLLSDTSQTYTRLHRQGDPTNDHPRGERGEAHSMEISVPEKAGSKHYRPEADEAEKSV